MANSNFMPFSMEAKGNLGNTNGHFIKMGLFTFICVSLCLSVCGLCECVCVCVVCVCVSAYKQCEIELKDNRNRICKSIFHPLPFPSSSTTHSSFPFSQFVLVSGELWWMDGQYLYISTVRITFVKCSFPPLGLCFTLSAIFCFAHFLPLPILILNIKIYNLIHA